MKKIKLFAIVTALVMVCVSCGNGKKGTEETKMLSSSTVKTSGEHSDLLSIDADSVKVMLVKIKDDHWEIRAILPMSNEYNWEDVPGTDHSASTYFEPRMGNIEVEFVDANGSPLDLDVMLDYDVIKSILSSNDTKTEDVLVSDRYENLGDKSYKTRKELFDKIAGISIKKMDLSKVYTSSGSSSSSSSSSSDEDDDDDDWDDDDWDDVEKAAKATKSAYKAAKAAYKVAKELDDDDWD